MTAEWVEPRADEVEAVFGSLVEPNLKRLFFSGLENPKWLKPLAELGAFTAEPDSWTDDAGTHRVLPWPEGDYLVAVAADEPVLVTDLLLRHSESSNPWVQHAAFEAALRLPAQHATRLVPQLVAAIRNSPQWIDATKVVRLAETFGVNHRAAATKLLDAAFKPRPGGYEPEILGSRRRVTAPFDGFWYREATPKLLSLLTSFGGVGLRIPLGWLERAIDIPDPESTGFSSVWRSSIEPHDQDGMGRYEITDALIDLVRELAWSLANRGALLEVVAQLNGADRPLLRRLAVATTSRAIAAAPSAEALAVARDMLVDDRLLEPDARPEYVRLAQVALPHLAPEDLAVWRSFLDRGDWQGSEEDLHRIAAYSINEADNVSVEQVEAVRRRLRYRLLLPMQTALPEDLRLEVLSLRSEFGDIEHPEFSRYITSGPGISSPKSAAEMAAMSAGALRDFLTGWQPSADHRFGLSVEGLARELAQLAKDHPALVAELAGDLPNIGRSYVRSAFHGWRAALVDGYLPSEAVWEMATRVVAEPDAGDPVRSEFDTDDPVWRWAQREVADFVAAYIEARIHTLDEADVWKVWRLLEPMTRHPDPTPAHEDRYGGSNMDPLTLSLNTTRPTAIRNSVKLRRATVSRGIDTELPAEILGMLADRLENDPSAAVAAVIGESLGHLWDLDEKWIDDHGDLLFAVTDSDQGQRERADVITSVALSTYRTGGAFIRLMRPALLKILEPKYAETDHVEGWRGAQSRTTRLTAATHITWAVVLGVIEEDDELFTSLLQDHVPPQTRGDALGTLGWTFMRAYLDDEEVSTERLARAQHLMGSRAAAVEAGTASPAELKDFYWWVRIPALPASWSLPILRQAVAASEFDPRGMIGEPLAAASRAEPALAVDILRMLLPNDSHENWRGWDLASHAPQIIAAALRSGDSAAVETARSVQDRLGRLGHLNLLAEVDDLIGTA